MTPREALLHRIPYIKVQRRRVATPTATVLACFRRFRGLFICHRLPLVAPARLHERSILSAQIRGEKTDLGALESPTERLTTFHVERGSILAWRAESAGPSAWSACPRDVTI